MALRAVAVLAVLVYHLSQPRLPGGFAALDVFFLISGYLITGILIGMRERDGHISLGSYFARRARRILPSALVVLAAVLVAMFAFASIVEWRRIAGEVASSAIFVENWTLILGSTAYAGPDTASPVQHYWTLAVEVQFYAFWGVLMLVLLGRRGPPRRRAAIIGATAVFVISLVASIVWCMAGPSSGYLSTATHIWELAAGGLVAMLARTIPRARIGVPLAIAGWLLIAASFAFLNSTMAWPGYLALIPIAGAVMVVVAGVSPRAPAPWRRLNDNIVVRTLADSSYAIYLWHWPLIVFADRALGHPPTGTDKVVIFVASLTLGWLTTVLIERPVRFGLLARSRPVATLAIGALAIAVVAAPAAAVSYGMQRAGELYSSVAVAGDSTLCHGAEARTPGADCIDGPYLGLSPDPLADWEQVSVLHDMGCAQDNLTAAVLSCKFGDPNGALRVALVGDSHAMKLWPPLQRLAKQQGWQLETYLKSQCEFTAVVTDGTEDCRAWRADVAHRLAADGPWDLVVTTAATHTTGGEGFEAAFRATWAPLLESATPVVVARDVPYLLTDIRSCVVDHLADLAACDRPRAEALLPDAMADVARTVDGVSVIDLTDRYCDKSVCFASVGGVLTHRDGDHVTDEYALTLAPSIAAQLEVIAPQLFASG